MKAAGIFSIASLAISAMASPLLGDVVGKGPNSILSQVDAEELINKLPVGDALDEVVSKLSVADSAVDQTGTTKTGISTVDDIVAVLSGGVDNIKGNTGRIGKQQTLPRILMTDTVPAS